MKQLLLIANKAKQSAFYLWLLNRLLWRVIPFNRSHKVTIESLSDTQVSILLPYKKSNQNHLKGMHACALATLCEYACGIGLMTRLDPSRYRIILKDIKLTYHAQAKSAVRASFDIDPNRLEEDIIIPLQQSGLTTQTYTVQAFDSLQKLICTGEVTWQLKRWDKVKHI
jgi:acyl-coenzyme A thioesterase PaaI-like protein